MDEFINSLSQFEKETFELILREALMEWLSKKRDLLSGCEKLNRGRSCDSCYLYDYTIRRMGKSIDLVEKYLLVNKL